MGIFDEVASKGSSHSGVFGSSPLGQIANKALDFGMQSASRRLGDKMPLADGVLQLISGGLNTDNVANVIGSVVNSGMLNKYLPFHRADDAAKGLLASSPLTAKLSMQEVKRLVQLVYATKHAHKNLFLIRISPYSGSPITGSLSDIGSMVGNKVGSMIGGQYGGAVGKVLSAVTQNAIQNIPLINDIADNGTGIHSTFNMLASEVNYTPFSLEGDQYNIGSAIVDGVKTSQPAEVSITTFDDEFGTVKRFAKQKASEIIHPDGTVGVLADGLVDIRILHAFVSDNTNKNGFEEKIIARFSGVEFDLSRRDDALEEFTMRFTQTDTFLR